ncbi:unconventional myosin-XIX [Microcaecilia unicolor]|uniref:Unconventional myosin-XIX n=1 Tax=Microcaecilia unicolor TaxID=1415580 RepID=A0A6P7WUD0_9AMPH|nr:unconventional myosin-XIX [Microcaecilia unicolor]
MKAVSVSGRPSRLAQQINGLKENPSCLNEPYEEKLKAFLSDEDKLHLFDDLTKVNPVTTTTVLKCLQARYATEVFYTNAGCTLVAVNPFQPIFYLYSPELMREYHMAPRPRELKPHIFTEAEQAYRNVQSQIEPVNQSIIVSGESGAGKTWTSRCLMKFYATIAAAAASSSQMDNDTVERIERRVLDSNPVMEAFGNACTLRNNNSSRFGKYIQLQLDGTQLLTGASVQTYLLEKTRVTHQAPCERNFHIFYQITKGASKDERQEWNLPERTDFFWLPNYERNLEEDCFEITKDAMLHLGIENATQNNVFKILSGLLHMGNIQFSDSVDESQPCDLQDNAKDFIKTATSLLGVSEEELLEKLRIRTIMAGKQQQVFKKPCSRAECGMRRDCLAKVIYARLFDWLVTVINRSICADSSGWTNFIGLLDVYGFESFPVNNLEQLCINYANEKLQQHFVAHYLKAQQEEYAAEGLAWSFISYQDNQSCVDLIEGSPASIFSLLNEECRLNRSSNASQFQARLEKALSSNPCISRDKFSKTPHFIVSHYAGRVSYQIEEMVEKNKDPIPAELIQLLQDSKDCLLQQLFPVEKEQPDNKSSNRASVVTVVSKFKGSLDRLMHILNSTTPCYIRCIKPNMDCQAMTFKKEEVLSQLEACGIVETINISAAGFPIRIPFQNFIERYQLLRKLHPSRSEQELYINTYTFTKKKKGLGDTEDNADTLRCVVQELLQNLVPEQSAVSSLHSKAETQTSTVLVHCGKTKVFMTHSMLELAESRRASALSERACSIQCCWRTYRRRKMAKQRRAANLIQAAVRSWLTRMHIKRMYRAASVIKRAWRKWKAKLDAVAAKELDDIDVEAEKPISSLPGSPIQASKTSANSSFDKAWTQSEILHSWPLGLVLSAGPIVRKVVSIESFLRNLSFLTCLKALQQNDLCKTNISRSADGITSIRALPQGSIRFHYKKSPLLYANVCPQSHSCRITGFNEILLEKTK